MWNFEHVFDGVHHQNNTDPRHAHMFEPRQPEAPMHALRISDASGVLYQPPTPFWGFESATTVTLRGPGVIDVAFCGRFARPTPETPWFGLFWASYPDLQDAPLFFPGVRPGEHATPRWIEGRAAKHLVKNTWSAVEEHRSIEFVEGYPDKLFTTMSEGEERFIAPLAYAPITPQLVFAMLLRGDGDLRLTQSPLAAWDAQMIVHDWKPGETCELGARLLLGPLSAEQVVAAYEQWAQTELPPLGSPVRSRQ